MKMKNRIRIRLLLMALVTLTPLHVFSENKPPIPIESDGDDKNNKNQRSLDIPLSYNLVNDILQIQMCYPTNCSMIIVDSYGSVVFDQTYPASTSVQVDLSTLPSGSYYLYIYAYDCWWLGEFEL